MGESSSLRRIGNSGLAVSVVGLGTNNFEANVRAGQWQPTAEDLAEIDRITSVSR
ncbi:hypothetical protein [Nocardia sp. NRRL WC-3656]|uniref:hypothetical protein n=1 Tax=Nocardia sp. NRRL WC-3656 TaxID=1463824 RepID=UPI000A5259B4|nr:hypothetical protein [Nocardia sp. NRRL WC-3656]